MTPFLAASEHLEAELRRLDVLLQREIVRMRAAHLLSNTELRGLYLSDAQVDALIRQAKETDGQVAPNVEALTGEAERLRAENLSRMSANLPLQCVATIFELDEFERDVLLLAAAPELESRYEVLFSYLNDDVTRKRPTCDLAMRLFCSAPEKRWDCRRYFAPDAPLFRCGLLELLPENTDAPASSLARGFKAPSRLVDYLLEIPSGEPKLSAFTLNIKPRKSWDDLVLPAELVSTLREAPQLMGGTSPPILVFEGGDGAGKQSCAEALCGEMGCALLSVDADGLMASQIDPTEVFALLAREQRLCNAGIYLHGIEAFFDAEGRVQPRARNFVRSLARLLAPVILACARPCDFKALLPESRSYVFHFPALPFPLRQQVWEREIDSVFNARNGADINALANQFVLTGGQIREAVQAAKDDLRLRGNSDALPSTTDLFAAARMQSQRDLGSLAQRIEPVYSWDDLILPPATLTQLREVVEALKNRHVVYTQWGFEEKLSLGKGLKALFAGESGTGKTMTAEVMARELGLDLYKIDLSTVVSKYIGETEKNLDRIFRAAQSSNAIIFFDEADALFGKRSQVKDAHDRYANIEVAYLLQKIEEYDGFVILATNLILNIDEAFKRRMNHTVEFPFPDEHHRELLWRGMFPSQTPLAEDLDFAFLARQFSMSGGNIKNAALAAAFLAAAEHSTVQMRHLIQAVAREWQKLGKLPSASDFKQYYEWVVPQTSNTASSSADAASQASALKS
jgi:AAA+ superfamily predicted ATPase